jgi:hypothetical protein
MEKLLTNFFVKYLAQLRPIFEHFQNLAQFRHFEKRDHSQSKINYMLLNTMPTISLPSNVNIVSVMFTGVRQCSLEFGDPHWYYGRPGVKVETYYLK